MSSKIERIQKMLDGAVLTATYKKADAAASVAYANNRKAIMDFDIHDDEDAGAVDADAILSKMIDWQVNMEKLRDEAKRLITESKNISLY